MHVIITNIEKKSAVFFLIFELSYCKGRISLLVQQVIIS